MMMIVRRRKRMSLHLHRGGGGGGGRRHRQIHFRPRACPPPLHLLLLLPCEALDRGRKGRLEGAGGG